MNYFNTFPWNLVVTCSQSNTLFTSSDVRKTAQCNEAFSARSGKACTAHIAQHSRTSACINAYRGVVESLVSGYVASEHLSLSAQTTVVQVLHFSVLCLGKALWAIRLNVKLHSKKKKAYILRGTSCPKTIIIICLACVTFFLKKKNSCARYLPVTNAISRW